MSKADVLIVEGAIGAGELTALIDYAQRADFHDSLVSNFEDPHDELNTEWVVNKSIRDTQEVQLSEGIRRLLGQIGDRFVTEYINRFYGIQVRDSEPWQVLRYGGGGHYAPHVDAETLYKDEDGLSLWEKTLDRDLSVVCFLNDDFEGGELVFPELDLTINAKAATLVCFPSDHNFIHGVMPVRAGVRFTAVTWMRVVDMPTPEEINAEALEEYHRLWPNQVAQPSRIGRAERSS